jgi:hypothetical protein
MPLDLIIAFGLLPVIILSYVVQIEVMFLDKLNSVKKCEIRKYIASGIVQVSEIVSALQINLQRIMRR